MAALTDAGLGLGYDELRLAVTSEAWLVAGHALRDRVAEVLAEQGVAVEQIGSAAVVGLRAKPVVDLAVGLAPGQDLDRVRTQLEDDGWMYRGDAGDEGGRIFVLEDRPWQRVAHAHVVAEGGSQWRAYLRLRDLLRRSPEARARYETVKLDLLASCGNDRTAYTTGKTEIVTSLLAEQ